MVSKMIKEDVLLFRSKMRALFDLPWHMRRLLCYSMSMDLIACSGSNLPVGSIKTQQWQVLNFKVFLHILDERKKTSIWPAIHCKYTSPDPRPLNILSSGPIGHAVGIKSNPKVLN